MEPSPLRVAAEAADPLASLPSHLLDEILRRLDIRDAVRTSALSRDWRRRWESVPGLALSFPEDTRPCVVDRVLFQYTGPRVSRFAFQVDDASASHVDHWLVALSRRSVESISLRPHAHFDAEDINLHSSIFACPHLVSLHLKWCGIPPLPVGFAGFPVLEELYFAYVTFPDNTERQLQAIIGGAPLLRVLSLLDVYNYVDCVIEAPNLHSLTLGLEFDNVYHFGELPCLHDAEIVLSAFTEPGHNVGRFLAGVVQVQELTFISSLDEVKIDATPFTFYNLKSLELSTPFTAMNPIVFVFRLLRSSPNLEKLKIQIVEEGMVVDWEFLNAQWTDGMCAKLQIVQIINVATHRWFPISFMKLILSKASLLRTLSVNECPGSQDDPLNDLLTCRRASVQAEVLFKESIPNFSALFLFRGAALEHSGQRAPHAAPLPAHRKK